MNAKKKPETGMDRLKAIALWQWGLIVIVSGLMSNLAMGMQAASGTSSAKRAAAMGRGIATGFFILVGIGLIIAHFVKKKKA